MISVIAIAAVFTGGSLPVWPLERQDRYGTGIAVAPGLPAAEYSSPWRQYTLGGGNIVSHPPALDAVGNGYFGTWVDNRVYRFLPSTGAIVNSFPAGNFVTGTPVITGNRVIAVTDNASGFVWGVDTASMFGDWGNNNSGIVGSANVGPEGDVLVARIDGNVQRLNPATGVPVWTRAGYPNSRNPAPFSRDDATVYVPNGNQLTAFRWSDGVPLWSYPASAQVGPAGVGPDGAIVFGDDSNRMYALNSDGTLRWQKIVSSQVRAAPGFGLSGEVYIGSNNNNLYAFNLSSGAFLWQFASNLWVHTPVSVDAIGRIYFHNKSGMLYCLAPNGSLLWNRQVGNEARGGIAIGQNSTLFVGYADNGPSGMTVIRQDAPLLFLSTIGFVTGSGSSSSDLALRATDGNLYRLETIASPIPGVLGGNFEAVAPKNSLASFTLNFNVTVHNDGLVMTIFFWNWSTGTWNAYAKRKPINGVPLPGSVFVTDIPNTFVSQADNKVRVQIQFTPSSRFRSPWNVDIDELTIRSYPSF